MFSACAPLTHPPAPVPPTRRLPVPCRGAVVLPEPKHAPPSSREGRCAPPPPQNLGAPSEHPRARPLRPPPRTPALPAFPSAVTRPSPPSPSLRPHPPLLLVRLLTSVFPTELISPRGQALVGGRPTLSSVQFRNSLLSGPPRMHAPGSRHLVAVPSARFPAPVAQGTQGPQGTPAADWKLLSEWLPATVCSRLCLPGGSLVTPFCGVTRAGRQQRCVERH